MAVFSGYQHWTKTIFENNIPYYVIESMTENINDNRIPDAFILLLNLMAIS